MPPRFPLLPLLLALLLAGCAVAPVPPERAEAPSHLGLLDSPAESVPAVALAASIDAQELALSYRIGGNVQHAYARLDSTEETLPPVVMLRPGQGARGTDKPAAEVVVWPVTAWRELLHRLHERITPTDAGTGIVLDVLQEEEMLLYYDELGTLRSVPMVYKPKEIRPVGTARLVELLREAAAEQALGMATAVPGVGYLLFDTGDTAPAGYPFLLMDLNAAAVHFLGWPRPEGQAATIPGIVLELPLYAVGSQLGSLWNRPFSSLARLFTGVTILAADTLQPRSLEALEQLPIPPLNQGSAMDLLAWEQALDELAASPPMPGRLRYLVDGDAFFSELLHAIDSAEHSISLRLYIFDNDDYALKIADKLKRRSQEVAVRILLDGLGTIAGGAADPAYTPGYFRGGPASIVDYLQQDSRIEVRILPNPWLQGDHTKAIMVDGRQAFVGGMNIGREYRYEWHDLMIEVTGPVAGAIDRDFEAAWSRAGMLGEWGLLARPRDLAEIATRPGDYSVRVLYTGIGRSEILAAQIAAIRRAQRRIYIQNAYFSSDAILYELAKARRRGVDVRVILPLESDFGVMSRSNAVAANAMLANGIRVFIYPRMSHVKGAVYDGWACFGSANFDRLSLRLNKELNLATSDPQAVQAFVDQVFEPDFVRSVELTAPLPVNWLDHLMELIADHL
jgi:cardiolipin synthase